MSIYENGVDKGYRDDPNWWSNPNHPDAFRIAKLDEDYPAEYFKDDHVSQEVIDKTCILIARTYKELTGRKLKSIIEFGSAGGWFTIVFQDIMDMYIMSIEATESGLQKSMDRGIRNVRRFDLRNPFDKDASYNLAICTEVAEHLEPMFAATLVRSVTLNSDFIWWSAAEPGAKPHLHHPNEQPLKYWINLFDFYGFGCYMLSDEVFNACQGRGRCIFFNKQTYPHLIS